MWQIANLLAIGPGRSLHTQFYAPQTGARLQFLDIAVNQSGIPSYHGVEAYPLSYKGSFDIFFIHTVAPALAPFIAPVQEFLRVMLEGLALGHSEEALGERLRNNAAIRLHSIGVREVPPEEEFQLVQIYKGEGIADY